MKHAIAAFTMVLAGLIAPIAALAQGMPSFTMGSATSAATATRTIVIAPGTRWVNVDQGEAIRFVVGDTEFAWRFDGPGSRSFDLQQVAPAGVLHRPVIAYVRSIGRPVR